jgi:hypothetical protein
MMIVRSGIYKNFSDLRAEQFLRCLTDREFTDYALLMPLDKMTQQQPHKLMTMLAIREHFSEAIATRKPTPKFQQYVNNGYGR